MTTELTEYLATLSWPQKDILEDAIKYGEEHGTDGMIQKLSEKWDKKLVRETFEDCQKNCKRKKEKFRFTSDEIWEGLNL